MSLRIFGGKGGVGKTTCAAAAALAAAEAGRGQRVLVVSTDPAHSLGDALAARLTGEPTRVPTRRGELLAAELAAGPAMARWTEEHRQDLRTLAARGTYLDGEDVDRLLDLTPPGGDELIAWLEIDRLARETGCDEVVVDTAPTAHTLRLLASPETLRRFAALLDHLEGRHREMAAHFGGAWRPDVGDELIRDLEAEGRALEERLRDPEATSFVWVLLPEALSVAETEDALAALGRAGIPVRELIVNRVLPPGGDDDPLRRERRKAEAEVIREIRKIFKGRAIRFLPEEEKEPRGRGGLRGIRPSSPRPSSPVPSQPPSPGEEGEKQDRLSRVPLSRGGGWGGRERGRGEGLGRGSLAQQEMPWLDAIAPAGLRLLFFGGKGGVGKTTCSAAVALALAKRRKGMRILLLSTDPAHSLADVLRVPLGDDERPVPGASGLFARELDASGTFARWRERHGGDVGRAVGAFAAEGASAEDLLDLTPPGLDELIAVSSLLDTVFGEDGEPARDLVIVDTAPTGHALRLLEMPALALSWDHFLLSLLLKYREVVGLGDLATGLVELSRSLKRLEVLLRDPERARFVVVTRAAELPRRETERLLGSLHRLGIAVPAVIVNAVVPQEGSKPSSQRLPRPGKGRCDIIEAPASFPPPRGVRGLASWVQTWTAGTG
ncbi:MAG: arsenite/tail-anchored protein-transporting ATPase [Acidobacteriota bacterium]|jgi:arsenite-transporting ATPase|nr:arsenite/tail-anchored protein-transporting ATPase [Acidobacteriota bacterium]